MLSSIFLNASRHWKRSEMGEFEERYQYLQRTLSPHILYWTFSNFKRPEAQ